MKKGLDKEWLRQYDQLVAVESQLSDLRRETVAAARREAEMRRIEGEAEWEREDGYTGLGSSQTIYAPSSDPPSLRSSPRPV